MGDLIQAINQDRMPNPNTLIEKYLANRVSAEIEQECLERFKRDILEYAKALCGKMDKLQNETEIAKTDQQLRRKHLELKTRHFDNIIRRTRYEILGLDAALLPEFRNENERQDALNSLPEVIQYRLRNTDTAMNDIREPEMLIERVRNNLAITDVRRQMEEKQRLLEELEQRFNERQAVVQEQKGINRSLNNAKHWRVGVAPCPCGAPGKTYNMVHVDCNSDHPGNLYYFNDQPNLIHVGRL